MRAALLSLAFVVALPAAADPLRVYVADVDASKDTGVATGALTPSVCAALERRPDLQVICAPDVRQMVEAAAQLAALGGEGGQVAALEERVAAAHFVVRPFLRRSEGKLKLMLRLYKSGEVAGVILSPGAPAGRIVELGPDLDALLRRLDAAAARADKMLHEPRNDPRGTPEPPAALDDGGR